MSGPEEAIREIFQEVAQTVSSEELAPLAAKQPAPTRRRWGGPIAAAACVIAVVGAATWVGLGHSRHDSQHPGQAQLSVPVAAPTSGPPSFIVAVRETGRRGGHPTSVVEVRDAVTGRTLSAAAPVLGITWFAAVTAARDNRMFYLDAVLDPVKGTQQIYRLQVDDQGHPSAPQPVPGSAFTMGPLPSLTVSPDGTRLMWSNPLVGGLTLLDLATGHKFEYATGPTLAVDPTSDDHLARVVEQKGGAVVSLPLHGNGRTASPLPTGVTSAAFSNGVIFAEVNPSGSQQTSIVRIENGQVRATLVQWRETHGMWGSIEIDGSGHHLLFVRNGTLTRLDLEGNLVQPLDIPAGKGIGGGVAW